MAATDRLLGEFADDWSAGRRPSVASFLSRAPVAERDALARSLEAFLLIAPAPRYTPAVAAELMADPIVLATTRALEGRSGLWPSLLPRLRRRARLRRDEVVARLAEALGLAGREPKAARYLHELETGTLDARGVSRRVVEALARILDAPASELEAAREFRGLGASAPAVAYFRAPVAPGASDARRPVERHPPEPEWDEVDRLFLGGREKEPA
jgi:hypothetical protein